VVEEQKQVEEISRRKREAEEKEAAAKRAEEAKAKRLEDTLKEAAERYSVPY
jgi:hypothetical protein